MICTDCKEDSDLAITELTVDSFKNYIKHDESLCGPCTKLRAKLIRRHKQQNDKRN